MIRKSSTVALLVLALTSVHCSSYDCAERATCATSPSDIADGGTMARDGEASPRALTIKPLPDPTFVLQGSTTTIPFALERGTQDVGPIEVGVRGLPSGISAAPLTLAAGMSSGDLQITASETVAQGRVKVSLEARATSGTASADLPLFVRGAPGTVDPTFAADGVYTIDPGADVFASNIFVTSDNRLVVAGLAYGITRLDADGRLDTAFGAGGRSYFPYHPTAVTMHGDRALFVTELDPTHVSVGQFDANGMADSSFGAPGTGATTWMTSTALETPIQISTAPDGDIYVAYAHANGDSIGVNRLTATGTASTAFGASGEGSAGWSTGAEPVCVLPTSAGRTTIVGVGGTTSDAMFGAFQLEDSGATVRSYGTNGLASWKEPGSYYTYYTTRRCLLHPDGSVLFPISTESGGAVVRISADGRTLVSGFGSGGRLAFSVRPTAVARHPDGKLLIAAGAITRVGDDGRADPTFGDHGNAALSNAIDVTVQTDGRIVVLSSPHTRKATITRLWQ